MSSFATSSAGSFELAKAAYVEFIENVPFYGVAFLCLDHPEVQAIIPRVRDRRIVTYGFSPQADIRALEAETDNLIAEIAGEG